MHGDFGDERFHDPVWKFLQDERMEIADILSWTFRPVAQRAFLTVDGKTRGG